MPSIEVDAEVMERLEFGRRLTGWNYSEIIRRLALVKVNEAKQTIADMGDLASGAPTDLPSDPSPQAEVWSEEQAQAAEREQPEAYPAHIRNRIPSPRDLAQMIRHDYLDVGSVFTSTYLGTTVEYQLLATGGLACNGSEYTSPGNAMKAAYGKAIVDTWGLIRDPSGKSLRDIARDWWLKQEEARGSE